MRNPDNKIDIGRLRSWVTPSIRIVKELTSGTYCLTLTLQKYLVQVTKLNPRERIPRCFASGFLHIPSPLRGEGEGDGI
jgi:hypothetical protein